VEQPRKFEIINLKTAKQIRPDDSAERACAGGKGNQVTEESQTAMLGLN
jgi:hypothetical protein